MADTRLFDGVGCWHEVHRTFNGERTLFLDRDGVVVDDVHHLAHPDRVRVVPGAAQVIATCNRAGIPVVLVTNQSGVGHGYFTWDDFSAVQAVIIETLARDGARLDAVFACAYHDEAPAPFGVAAHPWRKPQPGMLLEAAGRMNLDLSRSWIVGDRPADLAAGRAAGIAGGVLVGSAEGSPKHAEALALNRPGFTAKTASALPHAFEEVRVALRI